MPRERSDFFRDSSSVEKEKIFVLAFEGNKTEEQYFSSFRQSNKFNSDLIYLHLLTREKGDTNSSPKHVFNKLKKEAKDEFNFSKNDELWMIIDRDEWKNISEIITECKQLENMHVAVSAPSFEFWLLLHIKDISEYNEQELNDISLNKKVSKNRNFIEKKIIEVLGSYNKTKLKTEHYIPHLDRAILQSKKLNVETEGYPLKLGSDVFKVVEKIINR